MKQEVNTVEKTPRTRHEIPITKAGNLDFDADAIIQRVTMLREVEIAEMGETELYFWSHQDDHGLLSGLMQQELLNGCKSPKKGYYAVPPGAGKIRIRTDNE